MSATDIEELEGSNVRPDPPVEDAGRDVPEPDDGTARGPTPAGLSPQGANFIARYEGCVLHLYNDPTNNATIGVGHLVHVGPINGSEPAEFKSGITRRRALELLAHDAKQASVAVRQAITQPLKQAEFDALVSFTFNCGAGSLRTSTLRRKLNAGNRAAVPAELMRWVYSGSMKLPGLIRRRQAEGQLFANGKYE